MKSVTKDFINTLAGYSKAISDFKKWNYVTINHSKKQDLSKVKQNIFKQANIDGLKDIKGIYVYTIQKQNHPLYIGKSKNVFARIIHHYREVYDNKVGTTRYKEFWKGHKFKMKVYYKSFESENAIVDEPLRALIESLLVNNLRPEVVNFNKAYGQRKYKKKKTKHTKNI